VLNEMLDAPFDRCIRTKRNARLPAVWCICWEYVQVAADDGSGVALASTISLDFC